MKLINRTQIEKPDKVYNLHISKNHNYIANSIVVSNCHGAKAAKLHEMLVDYGPNIVHRFGLTGTLPKDACELMNVHVSLGNVIDEYSTISLIEKEWLARPNIEVVQLNDSKFLLDNNVEPEKLLYEEEEHFFKVNPTRTRFIADFIAKKRDRSKLGNCLVLVNTIQYGKDLHALIPNSFVLNGSDKVKLRKQVYDLFETNNDIIVICTKQIAGVGLSIDRIFNLIYIDGGKSFINTMQQIGRGLRKSSDKDEIDIFDICSNLNSASGRMKKRITYYKEAQYPFRKYVLDYHKEDNDIS